ncbi:MAG TPA: primosomal protein N' [Planctomycetaceae bacterium]|nr:primosomal protein N' [Planctomycetaceae bacterium]
MSQPELFPTDIPPWELDAQGECQAAKVVFAEAPHGPLDYRIPDELAGEISAGMRVRVPLGKSNRPMLAYCIEVATVARPPEALKPVTEVLDAEPLCTPKLLELFKWMSRYYVAPLGQVFEAAVPAGVRASAGSRQRNFLYPAPDADSRLASLTAKQLSIMQALIMAGQGLTADQLQKAASCSSAPIKSLRDAGLIEMRQERVYEESIAPSTPPNTLPLALSVDQRQALKHITGALESHQQQTILLHGVTGSGKTEVYMQAIHEVITYGRQAIVLVPEISLTPQTRQRFLARFGNVALLHSHLTASQRHAQWRRIASGEVPVVIGARSAVFAPLPRLGLIVLDEEHESTFKQDTLPRYHARDVALHRSFLEQIPLVLGSATPSLESWHRAQRGVYSLASLPRRILNRPMPQVSTVDLRNERVDPNRGSLTRQLKNAIRQTLDDDGQVMLLLNRRGFATSIQCPDCGHVENCPDCDLPLTHHRDGGKACCHYCDYQIPTPASCTQCQSKAIRYSGLGTQRLEIEVQRAFPDVGVARMDSDTMRRPGSHERTLAEFRNGQIRILLGTQMIAKGLDFPNVLLVGVINADTALHFPDFRAAEKTFQIVTQVAGRTGRGEKAGHVILQTFSPEHPAIIAASQHDFLGFAKYELAQRERYGYPPHGYLARFIVRGPDITTTEGFAESLVKQLTGRRDNLGLDCRILGPAPPPLARLRGKFRFHCILQSPAPDQLNRLIVQTMAQLKPPKDVQYVVDIDPIDTL